MCPDCAPQVDVENHTGETITSFKYPLSHTESNSAISKNIATDRYRNYFDELGFSTKINALMEDVPQNTRDTKSIIFSTWTRSLDLVARSLEKHAIRFERIDGDCDLSRRQSILQSFSKDPNVSVLIMTTSTGAFGLNLTAASRTYILEPQWNPTVEQQAIARAWRLGQRKPVSVIRYIMRGTEEESMRSQQSGKVELAKLGWTRPL